VRVRAQTTVSGIRGAPETARPGGARTSRRGDGLLLSGERFPRALPDDRALRASAIPEDCAVTDQRRGYADLEPYRDRAEYDLGMSI